MKMALGRFLSFVIRDDGRDSATLLALALAHYTDTLGHAEPRLELPRFPAEPGRATEVEIPLAPAQLTLLRVEAERRKVTVERLLSHAVLLYLADGDRFANSRSSP